MSMTPAFNVVDVIPDTPRWQEERCKSLGCSDIPAILSLSPYANATPLGTYRSKMGAESDFDEELSYSTHASEPVIQGWVERFAAKKYPQFAPRIPAKLEPGFMARSIEHPWLHATFDRISRDAFGQLVTWQFKTANQYAGHHWDDGVPLDVQAQVQGEIFVAGTRGAWVVIWIGGRDYRLYWIERDEDFIEQLLRLGEAWWVAHVVAKVEPAPTTHAEAIDVFPGVEELEYEVTQEQYDNLVQRDVDASDMNHTKKRVEAFKDYIGPAVGNATVLTYRGEALWTYRRQNGQRQTDLALLEGQWPDAYAACVTQTRHPVLRRVSKKKEGTK